jgi:hypothetical protein
VVSQTSALQLQYVDGLRFVPAADFHGTPCALTVPFPRSGAGEVTTIVPPEAPPARAEGARAWERPRVRGAEEAQGEDL